MKPIPAGPNGRPPRKQLSDQIDRLDTLLDGLAEALNGAVADATRTAVREALAELLTHPDVVGTGAAVTPPAPEARPSLVTRAGAALRALGRTLAAGVRRVVSAVVAAAGRATRAVAAVVNRGAAKARSAVAVASGLLLCRRVRRLLAVSCAAGLGASVVAAVDHTAATALSGLGLGLSAAMLQAGVWLWCAVPARACDRGRAPEGSRPVAAA